MNRVTRALRDAPLPDTGAEDRAWRMAYAAYVRRPPARRTGGRRAVAAVLAAIALALVAALTPAGGDVVELIRQAAPSPRATPRPRAVDRLPGGGRLLVVHDGWATILAAGAPPRRLAAADEATFSAFGRYVAAAHGNRLTVYAVDGRRVWSLAEPAAVHDLRWSPDGLRIAYRVGTRLRIVDANGERPRTLGPAVGGRFAWRPGPEAVLARVLPSGPAALTDVATGADLARVRMPAATSGLTWSSDGRRLAAVGPHEIRLFSQRGALLARLHPRRPGERFTAAAFVPRTHRLTTVAHGPDGDTLVVGGRVAARARRLGAPVFSPGGGLVLVPADGARWLFAGRAGVVATASRGRVGAGGWSSARTP